MVFTGALIVPMSVASMIWDRCWVHDNRIWLNYDIQTVVNTGQY